MIIFAQNMYVWLLSSLYSSVLAYRSKREQEERKAWLLVLEFIRVTGKLLNGFGNTIRTTKITVVNKSSLLRFNEDSQFVWRVTKNSNMNNNYSNYIFNSISLYFDKGGGFFKSSKYSKWLVFQNAVLTINKINIFSTQVIF